MQARPISNSTEMGRPETFCTPLSPPQPHGVKWKDVWSLVRSSRGCNSSSSRSIQVVNELTVCPYIGLVGIQDDDTGFSILARWKVTKSRFCVLSAMTHDLLTNSVYTAASEQPSSAGSDFLTTRERCYRKKRLKYANACGIGSWHRRENKT